MHIVAHKALEAAKKSKNADAAFDEAWEFLRDHSSDFQARWVSKRSLVKITDRQCLRVQLDASSIVQSKEAARTKDVKTKARLLPVMKKFEIKKVPL